MVVDEDIRKLFVETAVSTCGLSNALASREAYLDLIATSAADRANARRCAELGEMSGCALVVRGIWGRVGIVHEILSSPYRGEHAVTDLEEIAKSVGALHGPDHELAPGNVVIIDGPVHALTVVATKGENIICSIDGGQRDLRSFECIKHVERFHDVKAKRLGGRPKLFVIDCVELARLIDDAEAA
jgi:hypothetical protein